MASQKLKVEVVKHSTQNIDSVDVANPTDNKIYHQHIKDINFDDVSINLFNGEITPKITTKDIAYNNIQSENSSITNRVINSDYVGDNDVINLTVIDQEDILNIDNDHYTMKFDIKDYGEETENILNSSFNLKGYINNQINEDKGFDAFIIDKAHQKFSDLESLSYVNRDMKDFNLSSVDETDFVRNQYGKVKDFDSEFNPPKYLLAPYGKSFTLNETVFDNMKNIYGKSRTTFIDHKIFEAFKSETKENLVTLRAGVHNVGCVDNTYNNFYVGTKIKIFDDFLLDENNAYIHNNIYRPLVLKKYDSTNEVIGNLIQPVVAQSYNFNQYYIISKIKPHFILPSNSKDTTKMKLIITFGFLIDGKINENGYVDSYAFDDYNSIVKLQQNGINIHPIFVPKGKEFFIGISLYTNDTEGSYKITCLENGKYDNAGNIVSFPADVKTKLFFENAVYYNRLLKIDLYANVYDTTEEKSITLRNSRLSRDFTGCDRAILFSSDIYPTDTFLRYECISEANNYTLKKNGEIIFPTQRRIRKDIQITMSTNNKYVSPIVRLNGLSFLMRTYSAENRTFEVLTNTKEVEAPVGELNFTIENISAWKNIPITSQYTYRTNNGYTSLGVYFYLLRVDYDFHVNYYGYDVNTVLSNFIDVHAINKVTGEKFKIYSFRIDDILSNLDGNNISVVDIKENGWKRVNSEHILQWIVDNKDKTVAYPFIAYIDQFDIEVTLYASSYSNSLLGVQAIKNITCSLDSLLAVGKIESKIALKG